MRGRREGEVEVGERDLLGQGVEGWLGGDGLDAWMHGWKTGGTEGWMEAMM